MRFDKKRVFAVLRETHSAAHIITAATRFIMVILVICILYGESTQKEIAENVVRLHIVANSDSPKDQALKLKVRDAILQHMQERYPNGATRDEAAEYLKNSLPEIKRIASGVLDENGSREPVEAKYGVFPFPTKEYGNIALPAGMYEAVRVEIGRAEGRNWWCVMFPPLCVADATSLSMDEEAQNQLKKGLGAGNYGLVTDVVNRSNVPVKIRFRIVELVESSKIRLAEMISNLF